MENKSFLNKLESINYQLNLTHYWIIFLKYKIIIFLAPILFGVLGFFIALNIKPIFQSQATLVIEESTKNIVNIEEVYGGDTTRGAFRNNNYINNQIQILESDEVIGNIILDKKIKAKVELLHKKIPKNFLSKLKILSFFNAENKEEQKTDIKKYIIAPSIICHTNLTSTFSG